MTKRIRVLVIDDSAYNRVTIGKMLEGMAGVEVAGYAVDGEDGLRKLFDLQPDLVTLDLEMPRMGGLRMLQIVMQSHPVPVIVVSSLSEDRYVLKALELGAVDFVAKPGRPVSPDLYSIEKDLELKVRAAARIDFNAAPPRPDGTASTPRSADRPAAVSLAERHASAVVIGASTGGPPALNLLFGAVQSPVPVAFAVVQHMPPGFTKSLAARLNESSALDIREAGDGDRMLPGQVLICPGGKNIEFQRDKRGVFVRVLTPPAEQIYTPSVDVLFSSAAPVYSRALLAVVLTGMGNDGSSGIRNVCAHGGRVLAEAEESCVVYGMPKEALATGLVEKAVPLANMCQEILQRCRMK
ncbi:MAG: chemotaxis-specific protein-glutamate methyltransferase CheB [Desulfuromonadales bacterium]|nr:chemotaxis-specific protein-glutamate methyltransferase CheB [Desulfuromonadales bacterium]